MTYLKIRKLIVTCSGKLSINRSMQPWERNVSSVMTPIMSWGTAITWTSIDKLLSTAKNTKNKTEWSSTGIKCTNRLSKIGPICKENKNKNCTEECPQANMRWTWEKRNVQKRFSNRKNNNSSRLCWTTQRSISLTEDTEAQASRLSKRIFSNSRLAALETAETSSKRCVSGTSSTLKGISLPERSLNISFANYFPLPFLISFF